MFQGVRGFALDSKPEGVYVPVVEALGNDTRLGFLGFLVFQG